jgi:hypothetical protein
MKRLRIAMVKILRSSLGIVRCLVIFTADCICRKIIMTDSIKTAALMFFVTIRNMWTQACKSLAFRSLQVRGPMPVIPNSLIF